MFILPFRHRHRRHSSRPFPSRWGGSSNGCGWPRAWQCCPAPAGPGEDMGETLAVPSPSHPSSPAPGVVTALAGSWTVPGFTWTGSSCPGHWVWLQGPASGAVLSGCPQAHGVLRHAPAHWGQGALPPVLGAAGRAVADRRTLGRQRGRPIVEPTHVQRWGNLFGVSPLGEVPVAGGGSSPEHPLKLSRQCLGAQPR